MSTPTNDYQTHAKATLSLLEFVALMALLSSLVALCIDAILPALSQIGTALNSSGAQQNHLMISLFFVGMAFGQLFFGPFADTKGRRATIMLGLVIFALGTGICMVANSMEMMLFGRFVQAFGVSGPRISCMAIIRDIYVGNQMAKVMSFIMMVFIMVPMIAPIMGQLIMQLFNWWYILVAFLVIGLLTGIWFMLRQPETLTKANRQPFSMTQATISAKFILLHRQVMAYIGVMGCIFGAFLAYISASQTIYQEMYDMGDWFPYIFATLAFSIGIASYINSQLVERFGMVKLCHIALYGHIVVSFFILLMALDFDGMPPIAMFVASLFIDFFFVGIIFGNMNSLAMQPLGQVAGMGAALIGAISSAISVPIAIFVDSFLTTNILPIIIGFLIFGLISLLLFKLAGRAE
ncbi:MAG: Bicyclomycin resistance protein [Glaciecola sp. HTCC2999]|jgi:DHA1 family bicyclomycin/chloramphenicol resistance-like MFS transporter|nr:MAG: Bicyclomycin resistance protein [Glaciecola sp. HTCC2999]